jgi:DNA-binding IscR family transcriptional regulator
MLYSRHTHLGSRGVTRHTGRLGIDERQERLKAPTAQRVVLDYLERNPRLITSGEVARAVGISPQQASNVLRELHQDQLIYAFPAGNGSLYLLVRPTKHRDWTTVLSQLSYLGMRASQLMQSSKAFNAQSKYNLRSMIDRIDALINELISEEDSQWTWTCNISIRTTSTTIQLT